MKTELHDRHEALGAKMVPFSGWRMPVQYTGIREEHKSVRTAIGIFDVSHMGVIDVEGNEAEALLDFLSTNKIEGKKDGRATYTVWPNPAGGCVDDVIIFRESEGQYYVVANAGNREKDLQHLQHYAKGFDAKVTSRYDHFGILAVQGPAAMELVDEICSGSKEMKPMLCQRSEYKGASVRLSTTGYTGSGGCEIIAPNEVIGDLWDELLERGASRGIKPVGLGARDTLRLEMGFALYGHELTDDILPNETVSSWTVRLKKEKFLGRDAILALEESGKKRYECALVLSDKGIAREGVEVFYEGSRIGYVTSGTMSPTLGKAIAIALVDRTLAEGEPLELEVRGRRLRAEVTTLPFLNPKAL